MKIMFLSDTHGRHREITELYGELPYVDIMVHSGDCTRYGEFEETDLFMNWFTTQNAKHKVLIAGNHDFVFQNKERTKQLLELNPSVTYLEDTYINIDGIGIYGSPWSPVFGMWAFMKHRNAELDDNWDETNEINKVNIFASKLIEWNNKSIEEIKEIYNRKDIQDRLNSNYNLATNAFCNFEENLINELK